MAQSELDKLLKAFEEKNTSMEYYIQKELLMI